jgi:glycosyltransferase involved in cell wall biosynthesis
MAEGNHSFKSAKPFILSVGKDMGRDYETLVSAVRDLSVEVRIVALPRNVSQVKNISSNVKILGFVPFPKLVELYKEALFVVLPTKNESHLDASDCSGQYVLLDAMSLGKAIIASERVTLQDYFSNGKEGIVIPGENPDSLNKAIQELLTDASMRKQFGLRSEECGANFTTKRLAKNLSEVFRKVCE